jgi:hypothetical protein
MTAIYNAAMNLNWEVIFRGKDHGGIEASEAREKTLIFANVKVHSYSMNQLVEMDDDVLATIFKVSCIAAIFLFCFFVFIATSLFPTFPRSLI